MKVARSRRGARCNRFEADLYRRSDEARRALLCPVLWCSPTGALLVVRRARPMTESEFAARRDALLLAWDYHGPDDDESPLEPKAADWGWLDGRPVAIDYSAPMLYP